MSYKCLWRLMFTFKCWIVIQIDKVAIEPDFRQIPYLFSTILGILRNGLHRTLPHPLHIVHLYLRTTTMVEDQSPSRSHCRSDLFWLGSAVTCLGRARKGNGWTSNSRLPQRRSERSQQVSVFSHYSALVRQSLGPSGSNNPTRAAARQTRTRLPGRFGERRIECGHARPGLWGRLGNVPCMSAPRSQSNLFSQH